jgi:hypothetical protein
MKLYMVDDGWQGATILIADNLADARAKLHQLCVEKGYGSKWAELCDIVEYPITAILEPRGDS